jgi:hypothetical protein
MKIVANEIGEKQDNVKSVLLQSLRTAFKRRYGDNVFHLLQNRKEFGLPNPGTSRFNKEYYSLIQKIKRD